MIRWWGVPLAKKAAWKMIAGGLCLPKPVLGREHREVWRSEGQMGKIRFVSSRGDPGGSTVVAPSPRRGSVIAMNETIRKNILILEPERDTSELFARVLERRRECKCYLACKGEEALDLVGDISFDLLLLDIGAVMAGDFSLFKKIRRLLPEMTLIVDGYLHQKDLLTKALALGAQGYFIKPIQVESFRKKMDEFYTMSGA